MRGARGRSCRTTKGEKEEGKKTAWPVERSIYVKKLQISFLLHLVPFLHFKI